nr:uncharacterized protein BN887_04036 [Melanopsichium pennsylvanicum 4]
MDSTQLPSESMASSNTNSFRSNYEAYMPPFHSNEDQMRTHYGNGLERLYTSQLHAKTRTQQKMYPEAETRQAARMLQKARRREQNRDAQRRLRDRKEEYVFKLEGEIAQLRRQAEASRWDVHNLEEMIRRLMDQCSGMQRKLESLGVPVTAFTTTTTSTNAADDEWPSSIRLAPFQRSKDTIPAATAAASLDSGNTLGLNTNDYDNHFGYSSASSGSGRSSRSNISFKVTVIKGSLSPSALSSSTSLYSSPSSASYSSSSSAAASIGTPINPSFTSPLEPRTRTISNNLASIISLHTCSGGEIKRDSRQTLSRTKLDTESSSAPTMMTSALLPTLTSQWAMHQ